VARAVSDRQRQDFPEYFAAQRAAAPGIGRRQFSCVGPLQYIGQEAVQTDIANLQSAMAGVQVENAFIPAVAVGTVEHWIANAYYPSDEAFLFALADALHEEYRAIVEAGFILQFDNPNLPDGFGLYTHLDVPAYRTFQELRIAALNRSIAGSDIQVMLAGHGDFATQLQINSARMRFLGKSLTWSALPRQERGQGAETRGGLLLAGTMGEAGAFHGQVAKHGTKHRVMPPFALAQLAAMRTMALSIEVRAHLPFYHHFLQALEDRFTVRNR
jgi:hypothetical protein